MPDVEELRLLGQPAVTISLPRDYQPVRPAYFEVGRIYLAKGSLTSPERRRFVERICDLYPEARVEEELDTPHNRLRRRYVSLRRGGMPARTTGTSLPTASAPTVAGTATWPEPQA
jgi:hypothetical protein